MFSVLWSLYSYAYKASRAGGLYEGGGVFANLNGNLILFKDFYKESLRALSGPYLWLLR